MDSFFGLFDPSDGQNKHNSKKWHRTDQDNVKKKSEPGKGRRRSRKSIKNETLPEESSFLCEPEISTELLVKDGSYIDSYIELKRDDGTKQDADKKPKRRNSGRKSRRKKKVSPNKDIINTAWAESKDFDNLNNKLAVPKLCDGTIGKNVNDLTNYKTKRKSIDGFDDDSEAGSYEEGEVYSVIDKLEKVSLKDDMYQAGDFNTDDLNNDLCYSSDEYEETFDDTSEEEVAGEERGRLPPEPRFGNVEYKLQLVAPCERKFQHLVTQLKWRLISGGGLAVYVVGVRDCGAVRGLRPRALRGSLRTLRRMARALGATVAGVTARRSGAQRALAEVYVRKLADRRESVELRVAVMGADEAGKSTLVGVLTQGELDNGRGSARLNMFRHLHEVKSGRTSSLSHEILGFDAQGNVVNYGCSELMTAERIGERSAKLVSFLDLAGHTKYQRTTLHGLTGYCPHHAMLVISATAGITHITEEHIDLLLALDLPFFVVITKCELAPAAVQILMERLVDLLAPAGKKPLLITDENLARNCVAPQKLILDAIDTGSGKTGLSDDDGPASSRTAVFPVSCVRGAGLRALHAYLLHLEPPPSVGPQERCEFQIDEIFHADESSGPVVGGLLTSGCIYENDRMIIGPLPDGSFAPVVVRSVHRNRAAAGRVSAGQCASLGLRPVRLALRPGLVLLSAAAAAPGAGARRRPTVACPAHRVGSPFRESRNPPDRNAKNTKNLLSTIALAESSLDKRLPHRPHNVFRGDGDDGDDGDGSDRCTCGDPVYLEDPDDPRGCLYFQAMVQVLRHSTAICPGFQCTVHVGHVRQTARVQGIMSCNSVLRAGESASVVFRFVRCPEYLAVGRRILFTAGLGTRGIGEVTQTFPYIP